MTIDGNPGKPRVGFIGLGLMGQGMAQNLVAKGFPLTVRAHRKRDAVERLVAAGANEVSTNAAVAQAADVVLLCVTGAPQVEEIVAGPDGIESAGRRGLIVVDTSTSEPSTTTRLRTRLATQGIRFVDAPLSRTPAEAMAGRLNTMVGAADATFAEVRPVLAAFCENVFHVGRPGHGHIVKLLNNFIAQAICTATAEACAAAAKSGLSLQSLFDVVNAGGAASPIFRALLGPMLEDGRLDGLKFTLANAMKDLRYYTHLAESLPVSAVVGEAVHQSLVNANQLGFGESYVPSLVEAQEKLSGIAIVPRRS